MIHSVVETWRFLAAFSFFPLRYCRYYLLQAAKGGKMN